MQGDGKFGEKVNGLPSTGLRSVFLLLRTYGKVGQPLITYHVATMDLLGILL